MFSLAPFSRCAKNPMERAVLVFSILIRLGLFSAARIFFFLSLSKAWIRREILETIRILIFSYLCPFCVDEFVISSGGKWSSPFSLSNNRNDFILPPEDKTLKKDMQSEQKFMDGILKKNNCNELYLKYFISSIKFKLIHV